MLPEAVGSITWVVVAGGVETVQVCKQDSYVVLHTEDAANFAFAIHPCNDSQHVCGQEGGVAALTIVETGSGF